MSEYEEAGTGDKDARDFLAMRAENRLRDGSALKAETSVFAKPIGSFERHTKVLIVHRAVSVLLNCWLNFHMIYTGCGQNAAGETGVDRW